MPLDSDLDLSVWATESQVLSALSGDSDADATKARYDFQTSLDEYGRDPTALNRIIAGMQIDSAGPLQDLFNRIATVTDSKGNVIAFAVESPAGDKLQCHDNTSWLSSLLSNDKDWQCTVTQIKQ